MPNSVEIKLIFELNTQPFYFNVVHKLGNEPHDLKTWKNSKLKKQ